MFHGGKDTDGNRTSTEEKNLEGESQIYNPVFCISFASLGNNVGAALNFYQRCFLGNDQKLHFYI